MVEASLLLSDSMDYEAAWALQRTLHERRAVDECDDTLILLQHPSVYTVGRTGKTEHFAGLLQQQGVPVYHVERGGSATYHGPGQLVGYPILKVTKFCPGPKAYVRRLEEVMIRTLNGWGIDAFRMPQWPGVWVEHAQPAKIGAIGLRITRGVSLHGFALNVSLDVTPFQRIVPCGIAGCRVVSMTDVVHQAVDLPAVRDRLATEFADAFGLRWRSGDRLADEVAMIARGA